MMHWEKTCGRESGQHSREAAFKSLLFRRFSVVASSLLLCCSLFGCKMERGTLADITWCLDSVLMEDPKLIERCILKVLNEAAHKQLGWWMWLAGLLCGRPSNPSLQFGMPSVPKGPEDRSVSCLSFLLGAAASCLDPCHVALFLTLLFGYLKCCWFTSTIAAYSVLLLLNFFVSAKALRLSLDHRIPGTH